MPFTACSHLGLDDLDDIWQRGLGALDALGVEVLHDLDLQTNIQKSYIENVVCIHRIRYSRETSTHDCTHSQAHAAD